MIIFQITLTGPMLQYLARLHHQDVADIDVTDSFYTPRDGRFVTTMQSLIRQGLVTHESPQGHQRPFTFTEPGRRFAYQITPKGSAALQLAAYDLKEFLDDVRGALPEPETMEALP